MSDDNNKDKTAQVYSIVYVSKMDGKEIIDREENKQFYFG